MFKFWSKDTVWDHWQPWIKYYLEGLRVNPKYGFREVFGDWIIRQNAQFTGDNGNCTKPNIGIVQPGGRYAIVFSIGQSPDRLKVTIIGAGRSDSVESPKVPSNANPGTSRIGQDIPDNSACKETASWILKGMGGFAVMIMQKLKEENLGIG